MNGVLQEKDLIISPHLLKWSTKEKAGSIGAILLDQVESRMLKNKVIILNTKKQKKLLEEKK